MRMKVRQIKTLLTSKMSGKNGVGWGRGIGRLRKRLSDLVHRVRGEWVARISKRRIRNTGVNYKDQGVWRSRKTKGTEKGKPGTTQTRCRQKKGASCPFPRMMAGENVYMSGLFAPHFITATAVLRSEVKMATKLVSCAAITGRCPRSLFSQF